jgi:hypothetical protein
MEQEKGTHTTSQPRSTSRSEAQTSMGSTQLYPVSYAGQRQDAFDFWVHWGARHDSQTLNEVPSYRKASTRQHKPRRDVRQATGHHELSLEA